MRINKKSQPVKTDSNNLRHISIFDPNEYMLKLPRTKKVSLPNGQVRFEKTEADYLPVAARIAWFRKDHPYWSIITEKEQLADKAVVMKATIKDMSGAVIATARKKKQRLASRITSRKPRLEHRQSIDDVRIWDPSSARVLLVIQ